jgi:hypothetical protein
MVLQKEANDLSSRAEAEMQNVMDELTRVHILVASFQDQIREVGGWVGGFHDDSQPVVLQDAAS